MQPLTKKQIAFFETPVVQMDVGSIPSVGDHNKALLIAAGYTSAVQVLQKFWELQRKREDFVEWLVELGFQPYHAELVFESFDDHEDSRNSL